MTHEIPHLELEVRHRQYAIAKYSIWELAEAYYAHRRWFRKHRIRVTIYRHDEYETAKWQHDAAQPPRTVYAIKWTQQEIGRPLDFEGAPEALKEGILPQIPTP